MNVRLCSLTKHDVCVFAGAGRSHVLVVDDDQSHFVPPNAETVDSHADCVESVTYYYYIIHYTVY